MQASGRNQINVRKLECRMSNKVYPPSAAPEATREFRMMKLNLFCCFLRRSSFLIRPARYARKQMGDRFTMLASLVGTRCAANHFAGQAGILRFTRLGRVRF
jgi:hypothetical protein